MATPSGQDPNILSATGLPGRAGRNAAGEDVTAVKLALKNSFQEIGKALEAGLDPGPYMQDFALIKMRHSQIFKEESERWQGAAKHFINNLSGVSLAMNAAARMAEKTQAELKEKSADYTRAFREMGVAAGAAATQGKAALITGFGSAINAYIEKIREIEVMDLSPEQKRIAVEQARTDRDKALVGNKNMTELAAGGSVTAQRALASAIGTSLKDASKQASGVGGGGLADLMSKGGSFTKAIADKVQTGEGLLARMAKNEVDPEKGIVAHTTLGVMSKAMGSMPAMFQQLIGYAGQFTSVAMSWGLIVKVLTEVVGAWDNFRKMEAVGVSMSVVGTKGLSKNYHEVASAIYDATGETRKSLIWSGKSREIMNEAATALGKSSLAAKDLATDQGKLTDAWMRSTIVGAEFGKTSSESIALAEKMTKGFGKGEVPENMRAFLKGAQMIDMSFEDVSASLGDVIDMSAKFGPVGAKNIYAMAEASLQENDSYVQKNALLKTYASLLNAPVTYKAGLVMGAAVGRGGNAGDALTAFFAQKGAGGTLGALGNAAGYYMGEVEKSLSKSKMGKGMDVLTKGATWAALYGNAPGIAETYSFLGDDDRKSFDKALRMGDRSAMDKFIEAAGQGTAEQKGLVAMNKQITVMEKLLTAVTTGFQWVLDSKLFGHSSGTYLAENNINSGLSGFTTSGK